MILNRLMAAALLVFLSFVPIRSSGRTPPGWVESGYRLDPPVQLTGYENAGYRLVVQPDGNATVQVDTTPLRLSAPYPSVVTDREAGAVLAANRRRLLPDDRLARTALRLTASSKGYVAAVSRILRWIADHFTYRETETGPLAGDCNTAARAATTMLTAAGIPARPVNGIVMDRSRKRMVGTVMHRWVEIYYPGKGWLFSDPLASHHFVPPTYIVVPDEQVSTILGVRFTRTKPYRPADAVGILREGRILERINLFRYP